MSVPISPEQARSNQFGFFWGAGLPWCSVVRPWRCLGRACVGLVRCGGPGAVCAEFPQRGAMELWLGWLAESSSFFIFLFWILRPDQMLADEMSPPPLHPPLPSSPPPPPLVWEPQESCQKANRHSDMPQHAAGARWRIAFVGGRAVSDVEWCVE